MRPFQRSTAQFAGFFTVLSNLIKMDVLCFLVSRYKALVYVKSVCFIEVSLACRFHFSTQKPLKSTPQLGSKPP